MQTKGQTTPQVSHSLQKTCAEQAALDTLRQHSYSPGYQLFMIKKHFGNFHDYSAATSQCVCFMGKTGGTVCNKLFQRQRTLQAKSQRLNSSFKSNARIADLKSRAPEGAGGSSAREFTWAAGGSLRRSRHT